MMPTIDPQIAMSFLLFLSGVLLGVVIGLIVGFGEGRRSAQLKSVKESGVLWHAVMSAERRAAEWEARAKL